MGVIVHSQAVSIPMEEYLSFVDAKAKLEALEAAGVDNWEGYGEAMSILHGDEEA